MPHVYASYNPRTKENESTTCICEIRGGTGSFQKHEPSQLNILIQMHKLCMQNQSRNHILSQ